MGTGGTFKNKQLAFTCIAAALSIGTLLVVFVIAVAREGWGAAAALSGFCLLLFCVLAVVTIFGMSDITIDDRGISRRLFGGKWQAVPWSNIDRVKVLVSRKWITINLWPVVRKPGDWMSGGRVIISDTGQRTVDIDEVIRLLNVYIQLHHISVETDAMPGTTTHGDRIVI